VDLGIKNPVNLSARYGPIWCDPSHGPYFGGGYTVFCVPDNANTGTKSGFNVNEHFKDLPTAANGNCMYIDGDINFEISEVEVYKVISN
jgi:hypothetical protein